MNRIIFLLIALIVVMAICSLGLAAMSATASITNGIAMASAASAVKTSQVTIMLSVIAIIIVCLTFLAAIWRMTTVQAQLLGQPRRKKVLARKQNLLPPPSIEPVINADEDIQALADLARQWSQSNEYYNEH